MAEWHRTATAVVKGQGDHDHIVIHRPQPTLSGNVTALLCFPSFLLLGFPWPTLLKPTRLAADETQLPVAFTLEEDRGEVLEDFGMDCFEEETVGDMKRGGFLPRLSLVGALLRDGDAIRIEAVD